ncbi:MAG: Fe-S cluster assembly protein SufD [Pseudomonadota bacterium]
MTAPIQLTAGEEAILAAYNAKAQSLPGNAETVRARDAAVHALKTNGLPTRKVEAWHYTDLRRLLKAMPHGQGNAIAEVDPILPGAAIFAVDNGVAQPAPAIAGVNTEQVSDALRADVGAYVPAFNGDDDAIGQLNAAFVSGGYRIAVADGQELDQAIEIQTRTGDTQAHTAHSVTIGANATATMVERCLTKGDAMLSAVTTINVKEGATLNWIIVQEDDLSATRLAKLTFEIAEGATVNLFVANFGGKLIRQEVHAACAGENAHLNFRAINMIGDETHCDVTLVLDHSVPNTTSEETVRNVVTGKGQAVFQGQIRVAQIAQKTDAQMAANTLLLSDEAGVSVKPELEIFADDVICAHGATVAEIDEAHLFYLKARGISDKAARGLLVKAFVAELVEELEDEPLVEVLEARIDNWLEAHG